MPREFKVEMDGRGLRVAVVSARFNEVITRQLTTGAVETLERHGVKDEDISVAWVPGSFELPVVAKAFAESGQYDAVICLGAVIRGETDHYNMVANQAASGVSAVGRGDRRPNHLRRLDHRKHGPGPQTGPEGNRATWAAPPP